MSETAIDPLSAHDLSADDPVAVQRTLLALANDRLTTSLGYKETLRTAVALIVPGLADSCTIELLDQGQQPFRAAHGCAGPFETDGALLAISSTVELTHRVPPGARPVAGCNLDAVEPSAQTLTFVLRAHSRETGSLTMLRAAPRTWSPDDRTLALALAGRVAQAIERALLWQAARVELARQAAILRISRAFAESEPGSSRMMEVLLHEAQVMLGADRGGIWRWDSPSQTLVQVYSRNGPSSGSVLGLEHSLSGRAALDRRPVVANDYQGDYGSGAPAGPAGAWSGVAAPLVHEGRLIGAISVGRLMPGRRFEPDDGETLERLACMAASMLVTLERAQLQAVSLASRELDHRLNNDLALAVGTIDLLREHPALDRDLLLLVNDAAAGLQRVGEQLRRLQQVTRFQIRETPVGPALDLDRSADIPDPPA